MYARIDRRRKLPVTILLRALFDEPNPNDPDARSVNERILAIFFETNTIRCDGERFALDLVPERLQGETTSFDIVIGDREILKAGQRVKAKHVRDLAKAGVQSLQIPNEYLVGKILARDLPDPRTGELLAQANDELTLSLIHI